MFWSLILLAAAVYVCWKCWPHIRDEGKPDKRPTCPLCCKRVRSVPKHLAWVHDGDDMRCCGRLIPAGDAAAHWRLWHMPRPSGPEDQAEWSRR